MGKRKDFRDKGEEFLRHIQNSESFLLATRNDDVLVLSGKAGPHDVAATVMMAWASLEPAMRREVMREMDFLWNSTPEAIYERTGEVFGR